MIIYSLNGQPKKNSIDRQIVGKQFSGGLYCKRCGNLEKVLNLKKKDWIFGKNLELWKKLGILKKLEIWEKIFLEIWGGKLGNLENLK